MWTGATATSTFSPPLTMISDTNSNRAVLGGPWIVWVVALAISALFLKGIFRSRGTRRLPPGPRPLPVLGNALDIPRTSFGPSWLALSKKFGT